MSIFVHGNNLEQKEQSTTKYSDTESKQFLREIRAKYDEEENQELRDRLIDLEDV